MIILKTIQSELTRLWQWLWSKRDEVAQINYRDAYMAKVVVEILQTSKKNEFEYVSLFDLQPIHPIDNRENTVKTNDRTEAIRKQSEYLLANPRLSKEVIAELMPSATYIRVIPTQSKGFTSFEGNGRVAALKNVFSEKDEIEIEVDVYYPKNINRSQKSVKKLRKMHGMKEGA